MSRICFKILSKTTYARMRNSDVIDFPITCCTRVNNNIFINFIKIRLILVGDGAGQMLRNLNVLS